MKDTQRGSIARLRAMWPMVFVLSLFCLPRTAASPVQYCVIDQKHNTDQCIVAHSYRNATSEQNDLYLYLSAKFEDRKGYAAFGTGLMMDGSLMFIIYPGSEAGGMLIDYRIRILSEHVLKRWQMSRSAYVPHGKYLPISCLFPSVDDMDDKFAPVPETELTLRLSFQVPQPTRGCVRRTSIFRDQFLGRGLISQRRSNLLRVRLVVWKRFERDCREAALGLRK